MRIPAHLTLCLSIACATAPAEEKLSGECADGFTLQADGYCYAGDGSGARPLEEDTNDESDEGDNEGSADDSNAGDDHQGSDDGGGSTGPDTDTDTDTDSSSDEGDGAPESDDRVALTVDGSCGTSDYGYSNPSADAREALERTNCYRNLMGLERGILHPVVDDATQAHADYMGSHDTITHYEDSSLSGYTGDAVWDRLESAGYPLAPGNSWSEVVAYGYGPTDAVDGWMETVYHRIPYTTPHWREAGYGQNGDYSSMSFVSPYPNGPRTSVIFPVDGQREVPIDFNSDIEWPDPAPSHGVVGYPITLTVAAEDAAGGDNLYNLYVVDASLVGPDGSEVDCIVSDPDDDEYLSNTAFMLPTSPLSRNTTYTATMVVEWDGIEETITATFTTES